MKKIIFDFNGTLLNDVSLALEVNNYLIKKYLNKEPLTLMQYRDIFTFPIKTFNERLGFDFNIFDFKKVSNDYINYYLSKEDDLKLYDGVKELLLKNIEKGYQNIIISACEQQILVNQLKKLEIYDYFDEVLGISDIYAESKMHLGKEFIKKQENKNEIIFIGDTVHDYEVAKEMGVSCILISQGHQSKQVLESCGCLVLDSMFEVDI